jgi:hypothetical protein
MKTVIATTNLDVDALIDNGLFVGNGVDTPSVIGGAGAITFSASKAVNLMKLATALQDAALQLTIKQKTDQMVMASPQAASGSSLDQDDLGADPGGTREIG